MNAHNTGDGRGPPGARPGRDAGPRADFIEDRRGSGGGSSTTTAMTVLIVEGATHRHRVLTFILGGGTVTELWRPNGWLGRFCDLSYGRIWLVRR